MKKPFLFFGLLFLAGSAGAQTLYDAGKIEGGLSTDAHITATSFEPALDQIFLAGWFKDSLDLDPGTSTVMVYAPAGKRSAFIAGYNSTGDFNWYLCFSSTADSIIVNDIVADYTTGSLYAVGTFNGSFAADPNDGGTVNYNSMGAHSGFMAKYDLYTGSYVAGRTIGDATGTASITALTMKGTSLVIGGWFTGSNYFDGAGAYSKTALSGEDAFISETDDFFGFVNVHQFEGGTGSERVYDLYNDGSNTFATGIFTNQADLDFSGSTLTKTSAGQKDVFYAKYDGGYNLVYGFSIGGTGMDLPRALAASTLLINFENTVNVNPLGAAINMTSAGLSDVALVHIDESTGQAAWAKQWGNAGKNDAFFYSKELYYDRFYVGMGFSGTMDMDPSTGIVNETSSLTPVNAVAVELDFITGEYKTHYLTQASALRYFNPTNFNQNEIMMYGEFTGTSVDVMPYDSTTLLSHATNTALFMLHFDRCRMYNQQIFLNNSFPCYSCEISLGASVSGGVPPINFSWSTDDSGPESSIYGQCPGYYYVSASDYHYCFSSSAEIDISDHDGYEMQGAISMSYTNCGQDLGTASVLVTGNMGPYTLQWPNGDTGANTDSLAAGTYVLYITDTTGCYVVEPFTIGNSDGPTIGINAITNPACNGSGTGAIDISITGGVAPYTTVWSNGATTEDLSGLSEGSYSVLVTDASGCQNQLCLDITSPDEMAVVQLSGTNSTCFSSNGTIQVIAFGGVEPYSYQWDAAAGSQTTDLATALAAGLYDVTVTDANGCNITQTFGVSDAGGPSVTTGYIWYPSCYYGSGYIDVDVSGSGSYTFLWSNGYTSEDAYGIYGGQYNMLTTDNGTGCKTAYSFYLDQFVPNSPTVCMVTVDSTGTQNVVIWDKSTTPEAEYYRIYREGFCSTTDFGVVGTVLQDSLSVFYDSVVNTETRSWRYYVTAVDSCGYESYPSTINKTMLLTAHYNASSEPFLNWEAYLGQPISRYDIFRVDPTDSTLYTLVDSVGAFQLTWTDHDDLSGYTDVELEYYVEAIPLNPCYASRAFNQNASRSNHSRLGLGVFDTTGVLLLPALEDLLQLFPNPANDRLNIRVSGSDVSFDAVVMNQVGQVVNTFTFSRSTTINTAAYKPGVYFISITGSQQQNKVYKLVVAH